MNEESTAEKSSKLSLSSTILVAAIILGGFYYAVETKKQESIERQQQEEAARQKDQQDRAFSASQKEACLTIYKQESAKWNNVNGWDYDSLSDTCNIEYKQSPKKTRAECDSEYKGADGKVLPVFLTDYFLCLDGLFKKTF